MNPAPPVTSARFTASKPAVDGVAVEHLDRLQRELLEVLAERASLASTSLVQVMMWQPIASAWTTLSSSRGLAQISSARGAARMISSASRMIGTGSRPVSAIRPAKTEM